MVPQQSNLVQVSEQDYQQWLRYLLEFSSQEAPVLVVGEQQWAQFLDEKVKEKCTTEDMSSALSD